MIIKSFKYSKKNHILSVIQTVNMDNIDIKKNDRKKYKSLIKAEDKIINPICGLAYQTMHVKPVISKYG